ncbi:MAG TPA: amino acid permease [Methylococcus sp.]|nr:amino acid permease [Methylococcus sp.]
MTGARSIDTSQHEPLELSRRLGWVGAGAILAGSVIGTGIFLVPATIAREVGSFAWVLVVWLAGGLLSLAGALSYAELGAAFPHAGGEYVFLRRAYGPLWGFLYGWQQVVIGKTGSIASMATAFAIFVGFLWSDVKDDWIRIPLGFGVWALTGTQILALSAILGFTVVNYFGIGFGGAVQSFLTLLKVTAIVVLAALALGSEQGSWARLALTGDQFSLPSGGFAAFAAALSAALWAYDGWNNLTMIGSEIRDPERTIPRVLVLGLFFVMGVYLLANLAYFYVLPFATVSRSEHVAQEVASALFGPWGSTAITLAAIVSTLAALNGAVLTGSRIFYAMARDGLFFRVLARLSPAHRTPVNALLLQALFASLLVLIFGHAERAFERLFNYAIFGLWGFYGITAVAVIVLRMKAPDLPRPYHTVGYPWVPGIFAVVAGAFCASMVSRSPAETGIGMAFLATGIPFYLYFRRSLETPGDAKGKRWTGGRVKKS